METYTVNDQTELKEKIGLSVEAAKHFAAMSAALCAAAASRPTAT